VPTSQQTDPLSAGFVFLVDSWRLCDTFRIRLIDEVGKMNKQELLDSAVHEFGGKWGSSKKHLVNCNNLGFIYSDNPMMHTHSWCAGEFQQRALELGYINGYRWGVEYPTNGKKPDLPDDVVTMASSTKTGCWCDSRPVVGNFWPNTKSFKITDERYKPADASYLVSEIPESKSNAENVSDWFDYEAQKAVALPPVGEKVEGVTNPSFSPFKCTFVGVDSRGDVVVEKLDEDFYRYKQDQITLMPLDYSRKAEAEKKRVIDAVIKAYDKAREDKGLLQAFNELYDAGFLRMPAE
jgi:hypothetical protein